MKAVADDYKSRSMCVLCQDALEILRSAGGQSIRCGRLSDELFADATHRGSAPFARIAGKVTRRLKDAGLATWQVSVLGGWGGWVVTDVGRRCDYQPPEDAA